MNSPQGNNPYPEKPGIWKMLAWLHEAKLPMADWRRHFAPKFEHVRLYLNECVGEITGTLPCPRSCQRLNVTRRGNKFVAYPDKHYRLDANPLTNLSLADVTPLTGVPVQRQ